MRIPFVMRWQLDLSEARRENDRIQSDRLINQMRDQLREAKERVEEWKGHAIKLSSDLHDATARHSGELTEAYRQHHELAMNPPAGILKGPALVSELDAFPTATRAAIEDVTRGRSADIRAMVVKKTKLLMAGLDTSREGFDEDLARLVRRGEPIG